MAQIYSIHDSKGSSGVPGLAFELDANSVEGVFFNALNFAIFTVAVLNRDLRFFERCGDTFC